MSPRGRKVPIPVYVPPQIKDKVEEIARREGYSASEWIRKIIEKELERRGERKWT